MLDLLDIPTADDILGPIQAPPQVATVEAPIVAPAPAPAEAPVVTPDQPIAPVEIDLKDWKPKEVDLSAKPDSVKPAEAPVEAPPTTRENEGIASLRESYAQAKARAQELEIKVAEYEALKAQHEADLQALRQESETLKGKVTQTDPWSHPDVQAIVAPVNEEISKLPNKLKMGREELRNFTQPNISALTNEFMQIGEPASQGYEDRRHGFNERLEDLFPENSTSVRDAIARSADAAERAIKKMELLQQNGMVSSFTEVKERHNEDVKKFEAEVEAGMFDVSPEMLEADPYSPMSAIHTMIASSPAIDKLSKDVKAILRKASIPPAPISPEELSRMTPEARDAVLAQRENEFQSTRKALMKVQGPAMLALPLLGIIYKKWMDAENKLNVIAGEIPGGRSAGPAKSPEPEKVAINQWKPPPIPKMSK
jgi:hypothetical protein